LIVDFENVIIRKVQATSKANCKRTKKHAYVLLKSNKLLYRNNMLRNALMGMLKARYYTKLSINDAKKEITRKKC